MRARKSASNEFETGAAVQPSRGVASRPDVAVVVACHNAADTLGATIESIRRQSHTNWELIAIDDESADRTPELLASYAAADPRIRCVRVAHGGPASTKNHGVRLAQADHVLVLDADDLARPAALDVLLRAADAVGRDCLVAPGYELLDQHGRPLSIFRFPSVPDFSVDALLYGNRLPPMTLIPKAVLGSRAFDESLPMCVDWGLWLRLAHTGVACVTVPRVLFGYRLHTRSLSHNADRMHATGRRLLAQWLPHARDPRAARDAVQRLACTYGTIALASGDEGALRRYFADLPPLDPTAGFTLAAASAIHHAFLFVRGAWGESWTCQAAEWTARVERWLRAGPLMEHADAILAQLAPLTCDPQQRADVVRAFLAGKPGATRLIIYGLGTNGLTLLEQLRDPDRRLTQQLYVADDRADALTFAALGLPREDPRCWRSWPEGTVAIMTPNEFGAMRATLVRAGGREDEDFIALAKSGTPVGV